MTDWQEDLWGEALGDTLDQIDAPDALTREQIARAAPLLVRWAESIRDSGYQPENPSIRETDDLRRKLKEQTDAAEQAERTWAEAMAVGCGVHTDELMRRGNRIEVHPRMR